MGGETIIAAALGVISGGGGARLARALGPTRDRDTVAYYRNVSKQLARENARLWKRVGSLVKTIEEQGTTIEEQGASVAVLQRQVEQIANGELPPEYS